MKIRTITQIILFLSISIIPVWACKNKTQDKVKVEAQKKRVQMKTPDFEKACTVNLELAENKRKLLVHVQLQKGFHAYGEKEKIGRPVRLRVKPNRGWEIEKGPILPKGRIKNLGTLGKSHVIEGDFTIEAWLKKGCGPINGELDIQICTDSFCDRPKTRRFVVNSDVSCKK